MVKVNKTLKSYLWQLIVLGLIALGMGLSFSVIAFAGTETTPIFIPLTLLGSVLAYYMTTFMGKGGNVNYYFTPHTLTEDERLLDYLIAKYRNVWLMTVLAIVIVIIETTFQIRNLSYTNPINSDFLAGSIALMMLTCQGVKFITAWINIKRNWKKEFGG